MHTACKTNFAAISALTGAVENDSIWAKVRSEMLNNSLARKLTVGFGTLSALAMSQAAVAFAALPLGALLTTSMTSLSIKSQTDQSVSLAAAG